MHRLPPLLTILAVVTAPPLVHAAALPPLANLVTNGPLRIDQSVDVNVVLIGFSGADLSVFPLTLAPWTGVSKADASGRVYMGQRFSFRYHSVMAPAWLEDAFFDWLARAAVPQPPLSLIDGMPPLPITAAQFFYNFCNLDPAVAPAHGCSFDPAIPRVNGRFVTQNHLIDATAVEKVLSQAVVPALGLDVTRPTAVLINWWGRPDYRDHVYLDPREPDPETGFPRGLDLINNELAGYGGTSNADPETCAARDCTFHRLWFYDVSAGPMGLTGGFDLVAATPQFLGGLLPQGSEPLRRFHHTADYGLRPGTYRPLDTFAIDLGWLVGDVFLSIIGFGPPIVDPGLTPPRPPRRLVLDVNRWNWTGIDLAANLNVARLLEKMSALPYSFDAEVRDFSEGIDSPIGRVLKCTVTSQYVGLGDSCFGNRTGGWAFADLWDYFTSHENQFLTGAPDHEIPIFQFHVPEELLQPFVGILLSSQISASMPFDFAIRPKYVLTSTPAFYDAVQGAGMLLAHELGHYLGLSHTFNGYRCASDDCTWLVPYGSLPITFFSRAGLYVTGVMTYVSVNNDYSRFELDKVERWLVWQYLDLAGLVTGQIADSPRAAHAAAAVERADALAGEALGLYHGFEYAAALVRARAAYDEVMAAAKAIAIRVAPENYHAVRRDPMSVNQKLRDLVRLVFGKPDRPTGPAFAREISGLPGALVERQLLPAGLPEPPPFELP